jgi:hypothetical protein
MPSTQPLFPCLHARAQALSIWHDVLGAAEAEGNKVEALEVLSKILGQYKAAEEEESVREGATQEDKAHAVAQVEQLLLKVIDMDLPGTASYHDQYIQRLQKKLAASTDAQQSAQVRRGGGAFAVSKPWSDTLLAHHYAAAPRDHSQVQARGSVPAHVAFVLRVFARDCRRG